MTSTRDCKTTLIVIGAAATAQFPSAALAANAVTLTVGGFFREAYLVVQDDDGPRELGFDRNTDGFFNDAEIHFTGSTVLDNGLEVGARIELEGETEDDQVDEAWVWFSGGFGEIRIGSDDDALANACIMPPGGTANFSAFSPNQWGANNGGDNNACSGVAGFEDSSDAQKILYITPVIGGFQLTTSYTPDSDAESHENNAGPHTGMSAKGVSEPDYEVSAYLTYAYEGAGWGLTWGGGVSMQADFDLIDEGSALVDLFSQDFYQTGLSLRFGDFAIGGAFEYFNDLFTTETDDSRLDFESWSAGGGVAYTRDAWTFGAQYSYRHSDFERFDDDFAINDESDVQRVVVTANYALGPGIAIDGEIGYTWIDTDPEEAGSFFGDDYDAIEFGIGTSIAF